MWRLCFVIRGLPCMHCCCGRVWKRLLQTVTDVVDDVLDDVTNVTEFLAQQALRVATVEDTVTGAYVSGLVSVAVLAVVIPFASSAGAGSATTAGGALAGGTLAAGTSVSMVGPAVQAFQHVAVLTHYTKFNLVAPIAVEALGVFDVFNLWIEETPTNSSSGDGTPLLRHVHLPARLSMCERWPAGQ